MRLAGKLMQLRAIVAWSADDRRLLLAQSNALIDTQQYASSMQRSRAALSLRCAELEAKAQQLESDLAAARAELTVGGLLVRPRMDPEQLRLFDKILEEADLEADSSRPEDGEVDALWRAVGVAEQLLQEEPRG